MRQYYPLMPANGDQGPAGSGQGPPEPPDYKVYRSRSGLLSRLRSPDLTNLRERVSGLGKRPTRPARPRAEEEPKERRERPTWRRVLNWVGIAALAWLVLSFLAFAVSSQIQKGKLVDMGNTLGGNPFLAVSPQTILVLGTDVRSGQFAGPDEAETKSCLDEVESGNPGGARCKNPPYRSDTIMLIRAGGGAFRKLSIPRDTLADIPGVGTQKINAAYANGGARLTVDTVEQFLGINVDEVAIIDFDGFRKFIDSIGGVEVDLPTDVCSNVSEGAFKLDLKQGQHTLDGYQAITLARTRTNACGSGQFSGTDIERAQFQQLILDGIKGRLTSPLRLPYNFIKGPFIGWNAPKAMVSSMGALTMPQLVFAAVIGFSNDTDFIEPTDLQSGFVAQEECQRAVRKFLAKDPPNTPVCSPPS
jgi:LCP family protein required for cell wall assembly